MRSEENFDFESAAVVRTPQFSTETAKRRVTASTLRAPGDVAELLSDAPDMEGQTIGHWSEHGGNRRWALIEPDLTALNNELHDIRGAYERLHQIVRKPIMKEIEALVRNMSVTYTLESQEWLTNMTYDEWRTMSGGLSRTLFDFIDTNGDGRVSWLEFAEANRLRNQAEALKVKEEALRSTIAQYQPDKHAPECIAEGGQGRILVGRDLSSGEKVAIKVEQVPDGESASALQREFHVLWSLRGQLGFPNILHFGRQTLNSNPAPTDCRVRNVGLACALSRVCVPLRPTFRACVRLRPLFTCTRAP